MKFKTRLIEVYEKEKACIFNRRPPVHKLLKTPRLSLFKQNILFLISYISFLTFYVLILPLSSNL